MTYTDLYYDLLPIAIIILVFQAFTLGYFAHAIKSNKSKKLNKQE